MKNAVSTSVPELNQRVILKNLQVIPGIGKSIAMDLYRLGIRAVSDLKGKDPEILYARSNAVAGTRQDPCLLYTFRCAVYFAETKSPDKKKLQWWYWKDKKYQPARRS